MLQLLSKQADVWMDDDSVLRLSCFVYGASHFFLGFLPLPKLSLQTNKLFQILKPKQQSNRAGLTSKIVVHPRKPVEPPQGEPLLSIVSINYTSELLLANTFVLLSVSCKTTCPGVCCSSCSEYAR